MALAVYEEGGGAVYSASYSGHEVVLDSVGDGGGFQGFDQVYGVQAEVVGVGGQVAVFESFLVFEDVVVHLPELALVGGELSGGGGVEGVGMDFGDWEVAEDESYLSAQLRQDFLDDGMGHAAVGALVVAVLHQGDLGFGVSGDVVCCADAFYEFAHELDTKPSRAARMPSAPGLTPMGET